MNARKATPWVVGALLVAGAASVGLRWRSQHETELKRGDSLWRLTYTVEFAAEKAGAKVRAAFPEDTRHNRVFRQDVLYSGLRAERLRQPFLQAREVALTATHPGKHSVTARFDLHLTRRPYFRVRPPDASLTADERAALLRSEPAIQADHAVVAAALQEARQTAAPGGDLAQRLADFCHTAITRGDDHAPDDAVGAIQQRSASPLGRARALVALCRAAKLPARLVTGFEVKEGASVEPHVWAEVLSGSRWEPFDPENGFMRELPHNFLPVRRDGGDIVRVTGARDVRAAFAIVRLPPGPGALSARRRGPLSVLDLTRLPLEMHEVLSLILLLPLGALVTAVFRTIIGIRTFGTFTPSLIALSFIFADWRTGLFVFGVVLALGLLSRSLLDRLKLLMVPRLSLVLTLVVTTIVFSVSVLDYFHLTPSAQAVLLPMVILTMTIERFYLASEEDSPAFALQLLGGTVVVGLCCYLILRWASVGELLLRFPGLHFFTIAALVLIGRYTGYRLTELWRFRDLTPPPPSGGTT
ncbi:MAG: hypothetical protein HZA91_05000 [Verrucomicrobia bacterium]|nr:hypothetical protein [Verrucomicrobiota bacterium]